MSLSTLKPRLATATTARVQVLDTKAGVTPMEHGSRWMAKRERVALRFNYCCAACGLILPKGRWECDHIVPREQGGSNDESNLQPLCKVPCHKAKTDAEARARARG